MVLSPPGLFYQAVAIAVQVGVGRVERVQGVFAGVGMFERKIGAVWQDRTGQDRVGQGMIGQVILKHDSMDI